MQVDFQLSIPRSNSPKKSTLKYSKDEIPNKQRDNVQLRSCGS